MTGEYGSDAYGAGPFGQAEYGRGAYGYGAYGRGLYGSGRGVHVGSLLDRHVGPDSLEVTVAGARCALASTGPVLIRHGRSSPEQPPDAATCTVTIRSDALPALPSLGAPVTVRLGQAAADWLELDDATFETVRTRFVGDVTDLVAVPQRDVTGPQLLTLTAVSGRAKLGRVVLGDAPWPAETDGARAARILALAATSTPLQIAAGDAGTVTVLPRDVDRQPALALLEQLGTDTLGTLAETRDGALHWHDAEHRTRTTPVAVTVDASAVLADSASSTMRLAELLNDLTVTYGDTDPRPTVRVEHAGSIAQHYRAAASITSQLATEADAETFARTLVGRRSRPRWSTPGITVDIARTVDAPTAAALLALEFGDLLEVTGYPAAGPFSTARLWLEGWTESITRREWRLALDVSDFALTVSPLRWSEVDLGTSWSEVPAGVRWLDAHTDLTGA